MNKFHKIALLIGFGAAGGLVYSLRAEAALPALETKSLELSDYSQSVGAEVSKWRLKVPPGAKSVVFWLETWQRGQLRTERIGLGGFSRASGFQNSEELLVRIPQAGDRSYFVQFAGMKTKGQLAQPLFVGPRNKTTGAVYHSRNSLLLLGQEVGLMAWL